MHVAKLFWTVWRLHDNPQRWVKIGDQHVTSMKTVNGNVILYLGKGDKHHMTIGKFISSLEKKKPDTFGKTVYVMVAGRRHRIKDVQFNIDTVTLEVDDG